MKRITILLFVCLAVLDCYAQTPKRIIVEHFTNTVCSICSNRNPGFYTNLDNHPNVLHVAYHPSSPYSSCLFNMQNVDGNDDRTNYYGIYGSTPKLVIQGENVPVSADYGNASIFDDAENQLSPLNFEISQTKDNGNDIILSVGISNTAISNITDALIFVGIAEDIVNYQAPNGEAIHHDVFRKALTNATGDPFSIAGGEGLIFTYNFTNESDWNYDELYAYIIIQDAETKEVIQTAATAKDQNDFPTEIDSIDELNISIYPNPTELYLQVDFENEEYTKVEVYDISGALVINEVHHKKTVLDVNKLSVGTYFISVENKKGKTVKKFIKQ